MQIYIFFFKEVLIEHSSFTQDHVCTTSQIPKEISQVQIIHLSTQVTSTAFGRLLQHLANTSTYTFFPSIWNMVQAIAHTTT